MAKGSNTDLVVPTGQQDTMTEQEALRLEVLRKLGELGAAMVQEDEAVEFTGTKFILPQQYNGDLRKVARDLNKLADQNEERFNFGRTFQYRPYDGAAAFQRAMKRLFGQGGYGQKIHTMFGDILPEYVTINIDVNKTDSVPWGRVGLGVLEATFDLGGVRDKEYGTLFRLEVEAPKKYRAHVNAFFEVVQDELRQRSIYRGKAINGAETPGFLDVSQVDPNMVVYSQETLSQLGANVWATLENAEKMRKEKLPLKRQVLLEGPFGTGKSLAGMLTAQLAIKHGWTFILVRPGQDDLFTALKTAVLYGPAVVQFEDIDSLQVSTSTDLSKLLDMLDSISNKGAEIIALFTTNHVDRIPKGVLRPGRIDAIVHVGGLDSSGYEKLIKSLVPADQLGDIDYEKVAEAFGYKRVPENTEIKNNNDQVVVSKTGELLLENQGYVVDANGGVYSEGMLPAFVSEAITRVRRYQLDRTGDFGIVETEDLENSARGLRRQLQLMSEADEGIARHTIDSALGRLVQHNAVEGLDGAIQLGDNDNLRFAKVNGK